MLLTNIVMPRLDGLDLARVVTEEKPEIGVLYISAQAKAEFDLLRKPFTPTELVERIQALIAKRESAEAG
ncbi:MAG TPA: hypothetical protein VJ732_08015 [Bryobacteraceae bacterium]|nr:hypothetical protein [Bryobacteraceae bacterium]